MTLVLSPTTPAPAAAAAAPTHLVILIHGLFGSTSNVQALSDEILGVHAARRESEKNTGAGGEGVVGLGLDLSASAGVSAGRGRGSTGGYGHDELSGLRRRNRKGQVKGEGEEWSSWDREEEEKAERPQDPPGGKGFRAGEDEGAGEEGGMGVVVYACNSFGWGHTWDGVDVNAQRAAREVRTEVERLEKEGRDVRNISFIGYSLGGLIARYLVAYLAARDTTFFKRHRPTAFLTVASPHLGVLKYGSKTNTIVHTIGRRLFSRTGQQLYCMDKDERGRCLLENMAEPRSIFMRTLQRFDRVCIFANGCHDLTVPFPTAAISASDPFADYDAAPFDLGLDEDHIIDLACVRRSGAGASGLGSGRESTSDMSDAYGIDRDAFARGADQEKAAEEEEEEEEILLEDGETRVTVRVRSGAGARRVSRDSGDGRRHGRRARLDVHRRPRLPPVFFARYPFTYLPCLFMPLIIPLWLCVVVFFMAYQAISSARRYRLHTTFGEEQVPLLMDDAGTHNAANDHDNHHDSESLPTIPTPFPPSLATSPLASGACTPAFHPLGLEAVSPTIQNSYEDTAPSPVPLTTSRSPPLLLTQRQRGMIEGFARALPRLERVVAWFPWEYNSHATIVVRNPKMFPTHNKARGVLREMARRVLDAAE